MKALKNDYKRYVYEISEMIRKCYADAAEPSNAGLMRLYAFIGRNICAQGEKAFVVFLADLLEKQFSGYKGFSPRNLRRMRDYYRVYENDPELLLKTEALGWTQNVVIIESCDSNEKRAFYIDLTLEHGLSKLELLKAIEVGTFEQSILEAEEMQNTQFLREQKADSLFNYSTDLNKANKTIRSFMRKAKLLWIKRYRSRITEKLTAACMLLNQNKVIWKPPKIYRNCSALDSLCLPKPGFS